MKVSGVITEYNPFHKGHRYQLDRIRKVTGCDYIIVVMSGDFVQRGLPAFSDKYSRAQMALSEGADLVVELPCRYATASAEFFARGGVDLLAACGLVDTLCFGMESINSGLSDAVLEVMTSDKSRILQDRTLEFLKEGLSYPAAREKALGQLLDYPAEEIHDFLSSPNNILALEYEKALACHPMKSCPILRVGSGYHDTESAEIFASASFLRKEYQDKRNLDALAGFIPDSALGILKEYSLTHNMEIHDIFSKLVFHKLLMLKDSGYTAYQDCSDELSAKIVKNIYRYDDFYSFADILKSKNLTHSRITRALLHILLDIKKEEYKAPEYLRVLGFKRDSAPLLSAIKEKASVPLITKVADADYNLLKQDIFASDLYRSMTALSPSSYNEMTKGLIIL